MRRRLSAGAVLLNAAVVLAAAGGTLAAPPHEAPPTPGLLAYDRTLSRHVRGGLVDYDGLASERADLDLFLKEIAAADSTALHARSRYDQMAFWINAYNALTLDLVLRYLHGPDGKGPRLESIRDIPDSWSRPRWVVAGARRSLDEIEHGILRKRFHEPQVHFTLVCASRSCPALLPEAYAADSLAFQFGAAARSFLADTTRNDVRARDGTIRLSQLFEWYGKDFAEAAPELLLAPAWAHGRIPAGILTYLAVRDWLPREALEAIRKGLVRIEFLPYDWSLNDASTRR